MPETLHYQINKHNQVYGDQPDWIFILDERTITHYKMHEINDNWMHLFVNADRL